MSGQETVLVMQGGRLLGELLGGGIEEVELLLVEMTNIGRDDVGEDDGVGEYTEELFAKLDVGVRIGGLDEGRQLAAVE
jgi:hypothetical protein